MKDFSIQYLGGSGFLVTVGETGLLFDAVPIDHASENPEASAVPDQETLERFEHLYVFYSNHLEHHFSQEYLNTLPEEAEVFLGYDIPEQSRGIHLKAGEVHDSGSISIRAFRSTLEGVSFLVDYCGIRIFHAGSLNLWHWRNESSVHQIEAAEKDFYGCVESIPKGCIDTAFFPIDPRQGSLYDAGAGYFIMTVKPKVFIPMQFNGRSDVVTHFAAGSGTPFTKVTAMTKPGESVSLHIPDTQDSTPDQKLREFIKEN